MKTQDKRRDSGEYYPGGRVIARPGTAPQQVVVQWSDVQGKPQIAPLPDRYKDSDVKEKVNEIASKFATVVVVALIGWSACADVTVQKKRKDEIFNDEMVVVEVSGGGAGMDTNTVRDIVSEQLATNGIRAVDGAARPLPKYLHALDFADSYPDAAQDYYRSRGNGKTDGGCSSVRDGGYLYRNFDYPFDDRAEFVVRMSAGPNRFASVGVAQVGTNLTEQIVTSGKPSRWYKALPGATVDGINEHGVACNINVVDGDPQTSGWHTNATSEAIHPLAAVRWILDHATNAQHGAEYIAANIRFPQGWRQNFHYMIADEAATYIAEDGHALLAITAEPPVRFPSMTNHKVLIPLGTNWMYDPINAYFKYGGEGVERLSAINTFGITNAWYTRAYSPDTSWLSDFGRDDTLMATSKVLWAQKPKEAHRGETFHSSTIPPSTYSWWQSVHTSVYDLTNRVLRVAVQEQDDWYTFRVPSAGGTDETKVRAIASEVVAPVASQVSSLQSSKADKNGNPNEDFDAQGITSSESVTVGDGLFVDLIYSNESEETVINDAVTIGLEEMSVGVPANFGGDIKHNGSEVVYGITINGGNPVYGDVYVEIPTAGGGAPGGGLAAKYADTAGTATDVPSWAKAPTKPTYTPQEIGAAPVGMISATNPTFSNEVLSVGINTNLVASIGELDEFVHEYGSLGATSLGGLVLAAIAGLAVLRKSKADKNALFAQYSQAKAYAVGNLVLRDGVVYKCRTAVAAGSAWDPSSWITTGIDADDFATDLLGKQVAISAMKYGLASTSATVKAADRTVTKVTLGTTAVTVTFPDADENGKTRDFLLRIDAASLATGGSLTITKPTGATIYGDAFPSPEATKQYLVAITETAANEFYVRTIEITIPTEG